MFLASVLYYSGALRIYQRRALRGRAVVLMYHRVLTPAERAHTGSHPGIVVTTETFARQMAVLRRWFHVLSLEQFAHHVEHGIPFPDSSCLITFDDGWKDNLVNGLPVLRQYDLPAIVFLPVQYIGARTLFWREALTHLLVRAVDESSQRPQSRPALAEALAPIGLEHLLERRQADHRTAVIEAVGARPDLTDVSAGGVISALSGQLGIQIEQLETPDTFIGWGQASVMAGAKVAFGGHGVTHRLLARLPQAEVEAEVRGSKAVLEANVAVPVPSFSYPNGSWNRRVAECVRAAGYRLAFTTVPGFVSCGDDPLTLRRQNVHEDATNTAPTFVASVLGVL